MKQILILIVCFPFFGYSQFEFPLNENGHAEYTEVVEAGDLKADQLFSNAKMFVAKSATNSKAVTDMVDESTKTIVVKGSIPVYYYTDRKKAPYGAVHTHLTISCKDGRYKYLLTNFEHKFVYAGNDFSGGAITNEKPACGTLRFTKKAWQTVQKSAAYEIKIFIESLKKEMVSTSSNDW